MSSPREIGGFYGAFESRELPPWPVSAQLRAGRQRQGPRQGELPASLPASLIGSL